MIDFLKQSIHNFLQENQLASESEELACHGVLLFGALLFSALIGYICRKIIAPLLLKLVKKTDTLWDDYLLNGQLIRALCRVVPGIVFYILLPFCLSEDHAILSNVMLQGSKIYIAITFISLTTVFLGNVETFTLEEEKFKDKHLYGIIEFLKIVVYFIGGIIIIAFLLGQNPFSMVAGIGAAATVLMLVFKDSILGLVAGVQLSSNRMIKPGDWITIKKSNIDGTVEKISLTTVKVRNFDNTIYTVPPYTLISEPFQNWSTMYEGGGRRMKRALFIDMNTVGFCDEAMLRHLVETAYLTTEEAAAAQGKVNLTLFREYVERYLKAQSFVIAEKTVMARQLSPTPNGLPLEFYFFLNITAFTEYESLCAACVEHFIATLPDFGLRVFQSPAGRDLAECTLKK